MTCGCGPGHASMNIIINYIFQISSGWPAGTKCKLSWDIVLGYSIYIYCYNNSSWKEMAQEAFLGKIMELHNSLTAEQRERVIEITKEDGINEDLHLLLLGRPGVGKSTFAGELTGGKIKGSSGPSGGTKSSNEPGQWRHIKTEKMEEEISTKTDGSDTKKACFVYDTVGLGDVTVDLDEMKREAKEVCEQSGHCNVFLCIGWEDRINDINTQIAFDVCDSLGMWQNVTVVITKCDSTYQESDPNSEEFIKRIEHDWKESITKKLESMHVEGSEIAKITENITFYPNRIKQGYKESLLTWAGTFIRRLKDIIQYEKRMKNGVSALSNGISFVSKLLRPRIESFSCIHQPQDRSQDSDDQVQEVDGSYVYIDDSCVTSTSTCMPAGNQQSHKKKGSSRKATGEIAEDAIGGGAVAVGLIGTLVIGGTAAFAGGVAIGAATGGVGVVVGALIIGLIAYFYFKED